MSGCVDCDWLDIWMDAWVMTGWIYEWLGGLWLVGYMNGCVDCDWLDMWMDAWVMTGWIYEWLGGLWLVGYMNGCVDCDWLDIWMDAWVMTGWICEWMHGLWLVGYVNGWVGYGWLDIPSNLRFFCWADVVPVHVCPKGFRVSALTLKLSHKPPGFTFKVLCYFAVYPRMCVLECIPVLLIFNLKAHFWE
jgi:hypothetical protein